jgi:hypothetical protein
MIKHIPFAQSDLASHFFLFLSVGQLQRGLTARIAALRGLSQSVAGFVGIIQAIKNSQRLIQITPAQPMNESGFPYPRPPALGRSFPPRAYSRSSLGYVPGISGGQRYYPAT